MSFRRKRQPSSPPRSLPVSPLDDAFAAASAEVARRALETPKPAKPAKPVVPVYRGEEPVRALKAAQLALTRTGVFFTSLTAHGGYSSGRPIEYGPQAVSQCFCMEREMAASPFSYGPSWAQHRQPGPRTACGFYTWKPHVPFPWEAGTWLLEVDLYGRVIEHKHGYRGEKQRVLRISPVPGLFCESPLELSADAKGLITARCKHCESAGHPVSVERLRGLLNVEVELDWASAMREEG